MMRDFLLKALRITPRRVQTSLYHRFLIHHKSWYKERFEAARLKVCPSITMNLSQTDGFHGEIALFGIYEQETTRLIHAIAREQGGLMVDVGANYGYFSLLWCGARADNRAYAIEASPLNVTPLRENVERNRLVGRLGVHEWAASNTEGQVTFNLGSRDETGWGGIASPRPSVSQSNDSSAGEDLMVTVPGHRLDAMFPDEPISVLKIDCEGADAWVLEGASALLEAGRICHLFFEENLYRQTQLGIKAGSALQTLERFGYQWKLLSSDPGIPNYHAWR